MVTLKVANNVRGEIILTGIEGRILKAGNKIVLNQAQMNLPSVKSAINAGALVIEKDLREDDKPNDVAEKAEDIKTTEKVEEKKTEKQNNEDFLEFEEDKKSEMRAWDAESKSMIDRDESSEKVREQNNGVDMNVQQDEIDFDSNDAEEQSKSEDSDKKESKSKKTKKVTGKKSTRKKSTSSKKKGGRKKKTTLKEKMSKENIDKAENKDDVEFVDVEQMNEAVKKHPVLSDYLDDIIEDNE